MSSHYDIPSWAAQPCVGLHLDVMKEDKLTQKLMIDTKRCYLFGRSRELNDFCLQHASCSRVHAALVWHGCLQRAFLVDLASTHGTFVGRLRLEPHKPTQLPVGAAFRFGASSRTYILRERPNQQQQQQQYKHVMDTLEAEVVAPGQQQRSGWLGAGLDGSASRVSALMLRGGRRPQEEEEEDERALDTLTEYNTAQNRRVCYAHSHMVQAPGAQSSTSTTAADRTVRFTESADEIINLEDVDPSVGRYRNLVSSVVVPRTTASTRQAHLVPAHGRAAKVPRVGEARDRGDVTVGRNDLYDDTCVLAPPPSSTSLLSGWSLFGTKIRAINSAPDVGDSDSVTERTGGDEVHAITRVDGVTPQLVAVDSSDGANIPRKKKYAKEMWPGKRGSLPTAANPLPSAVPVNVGFLL